MKIVRRCLHTHTHTDRICSDKFRDESAICFSCIRLDFHVGLLLCVIYVIYISLAFWAAPFVYLSKRGFGTDAKIKIVSTHSIDSGKVFYTPEFGWNRSSVVNKVLFEFGSCFFLSSFCVFGILIENFTFLKIVKIIFNT